MTELDVPTRRTRRRRRLVWIALLALLVIALPVGIWLYFSNIADRRLREAVADVDRLDPGWRMEHLDSGRAEIPDDANGALCVLRARDSMAPVPHGWEADQALSDLEPQHQLSAPQIALLQTEVKTQRPALLEAIKLADLPQGRYPITWLPSVHDTDAAHGGQLQGVRPVMTLLFHAAMLHAQDQDYHEALRHCRATLNVGRSIGDEPFSISHLIRLAGVSVACAAIERTLAQGQPEPADLAATQRLVEDEDRAEDALFLIAARGERAAFHQFWDGVESGRHSVSGAPSLGDRLGTVWSMGWIKDQHARSLPYFTRLVEVANLPPHQRGAKLAELESAVEGEHLVQISLLIPAVAKVDDAVRRTQGRVRCTAVALAVERFRLATGRWPDSLAALLPEQLRRVPSDPFDGKPLRFRRLQDGVVIYAVGPDGMDNGGTLDRKHPARPGSDVGVRLWDVARRRQPPPAAEAPPPPREGD
jgi:hypothetical protein